MNDLNVMLTGQGARRPGDAGRDTRPADWYFDLDEPVSNGADTNLGNGDRESDHPAANSAAGAAKYVFDTIAVLGGSASSLGEGSAASRSDIDSPGSNVKLAQIELPAPSASVAGNRITDGVGLGSQPLTGNIGPGPVSPGVSQTMPASVSATEDARANTRSPVAGSAGVRGGTFYQEDSLIFRNDSLIG